MRQSAVPAKIKSSLKAKRPLPLTVGQVVLRIKSLIEQTFPTNIWVEGEVSNCTHHTSGHIYFSLVDEHATDRFGQRLLLPCAFFRHVNQHLKFKLEDGMKVLCRGDVATYESRGQYQLRVLQVEPKGIGSLQLAFEQLKRRLSAEGLFDEDRKRAIPASPNRIAVITSLTGSAVHDMVSKLRGWFDVVIVPSKVQGDGAADEIAEMIAVVNAKRLADVLIVGRGGGSVEDLWAFNEEVLARAIAKSRIPIISAVGHQDDWTIADYVSDLRASTPTDAARYLVEEQQGIAQHSRLLVQQLVDGMERFLDEAHSCVTLVVRQLRLLHPLYQLREYESRVRGLVTEIVGSMRHFLDSEVRQLNGLAGRLQALSPLAVLSRGYSITFKLPSREVVTDASYLKQGEHIETKLSCGSIISSVTHIERT